jgi:UDP-N-acetylmuramoyl-L-alanyl-D-glutamate--2,6-diaminopimelate ligase
MTELAYPSGLSRQVPAVSLRSVRDVLTPVAVHRYRELDVEGLAFHHGEVRPGNLFFAIRGVKQDGAQFAQHAAQRGAAAIVAETDLEVPCPVLQVGDARRALAETAGWYYGHPSKVVETVGVTGTNGKTTVTWLIRHCLEAVPRSCGLIGTTGIEYAGRRLPSHNTTPDPVQLQGFLREMADRRVFACAMEVSSHALTQQRVHGLDFRVGVFLNLSQDHLDYHQDMREYAAAKSRLFRQLRPGAHACIARNLPGSSAMLAAVGDGVTVHTFGLDAEADVNASDLRCTLEGTRLRLGMPNGRVDLFLRLPGEHNVRNALAAASAALALGVSELTIAAALESARPVRGRLELVGTRGGVRVFVDYAHTPDALDKVCSALRRLGGGRLLVVFGCGGDRDRGKRPLMTQAVLRHADVALMTSDNPRSEDPEAILDEMGKGLPAAFGEVYRIVDRAAAIRAAIQQAHDGDTVLIAGKGHETCQILRDRVVPFDDALVAREELAARPSAGSGEQLAGEGGA